MTQAVIPAKAVVGRITSASLKSSAAIVLQAALFGSSYYLAVRLGLSFRFQSSQIGVVWPANAVLLSALLLTNRSRWWIVVMAAAMAHVAGMSPTSPAWRWSWQIVANSAFTMTTAEMLRRFAGLPLHFGSRRQVVAFTAIAFIMPAVFALVLPAFVRAVLELDPLYSSTDAFLRIVLSNSTAILLVTPVVLLWTAHGVRRLRDLPRDRLLEGTIIMVSVLIAGAIAFGTGPEIARFPWVLPLLFPPLLWAAVRLGPLGAATSLFCVAAISVVGTVGQLGPFVLITHADQVIALQLFWVAICPPVLLLAAVIHEREQVEEALQEQRNHLAHVTRVATAGEMSGALAHELRQPLMAILANAQAAIRFLDRQPANITEVREILHDIVRHDRQAADVISRLRAFLREGESRFEPLIMDTIVRDALALSRSAIELSGVDVQTQIAPGLPTVRGDPVQLLQVVLNLIVNGCESMVGVPASERRLRLVVAQPDAHHVQVSVVDAGIGLPHDRSNRVFEPFFTTKDKGLGLGLAIGRSIVSAHHGSLWCENNAHRGATFHLLLPTGSGHDGSSAHRDRR